MSQRLNILIIMVDQLTGTFFPDGPADFLHAPNLSALAERSARFGKCYNASPLCAPSRAAFMTGQLPSRTGVYDNAAAFPSDLPTYAHHLRRLGYRTALSGKMHFVGPDQLHGFEARLTTDIYPADFGWTPDYTRPDDRIDWWYHNLGSVTGAGTAEITNQMEYDDEVAHFGIQQIYDLARAGDDRPFCLTVSFTHPHDPYVARRTFYDLYPDGIPAPRVPAIAYDDQDPHSQRLMRASDWQNYPIAEADIARSRRAYAANISYLDDKIGALLDTLSACRLDDRTAVVFCADHGDMLGERGLWFKMSFFEGSSRVPLMIAAPDMSPGLVEDPVSLIDVTPTLADLAGADMSSVAHWTDGETLLPFIEGSRRETPVLMEYAAEGSVAPMVSIRQGRWKFNHCAVDPPQLFDLDADPSERTNLAADPAHAETVTMFTNEVHRRWNLATFDDAVRQSQARRHIAYEALRNGAYYPWDFQPLRRASERYMRNHLDLNDLEESTRFPRGD